MGGENGLTDSPPKRLLDRFRDLVPRALKALVFDSLVNSRALSRWAAGSDGIVTSRGLRFDVGTEYIHYAAAIRLGLYERAERFMAATFYDGTRDVVELGASMGVISCQLASGRKPGVRLIAVEAEPTLARRARRNLELNCFTDVHVANRAIDYSGAQTVGFSGGLGLAGRLSQSGNLQVPASTLSDILDEYAVGEFDLVMDIEGAEDAVLRAEGDALRRCRRMLVEFDSDHLDAEGTPPLLAELGFRMIYRHESCAAFERVDHSMR